MADGVSLIAPQGNRLVLNWLGAGAADVTAPTNRLAFNVDNVVMQALVQNGNCAKLCYLQSGPNWYLRGWDNSFATNFDAQIAAMSDVRIKENIAPTGIDALATLNAIPVTQFDIKAEVEGHYASLGKEGAERDDAIAHARPRHVGIGLVADDVQPHIPEMVFDGGEQGPNSPLPDHGLKLAQQNAIPYLIRAIQQLTEKVEQLQRSR